jgi:hypothetical protein
MQIQTQQQQKKRKFNNPNRHKTQFPVGFVFCKNVIKNQKFNNKD